MVEEAEVVTGFYEAAFDAVRFRHALSCLGEFGSGMGATLLLWDKRAAEPALLAHSGHQGDEVFDLYRRHYALIDPFRPVLEAMAANAWTQCANHFDARFLAQSAWFNELIVPQGVRHLASARIAIEARFDVFLNVQRAAEPFSASELRRFERVGRHLGRAIKTYLYVTRAKLERAVAAALPSRLGTPAVLVGASVRVLFANRAAEALLGRDGPLAIRSGHLDAARDNDGRHLSRIVGIAATTGVGGDMVIHRGPGQASIRVLVVPAGSVTTLYGTEPVQSALVLLEDRAVGPGRSSAALRRSFGLTRAEVAVANALLDGQRLRDVAASRRVSVETVRTQLRSLFKKTGTSRQSDLVRVLLGARDPGE